MSNTVIQIENLGKSYRIGTPVERAKNLSQSLRNLAASPFNYLLRMLREPTEDETLWALRDISFKVEQGEVLGIIGRNGAGKSTLLKILSRITEPSVGEVRIYGRVASLLEVGTGFHPELTGRENIFLNGTILGMSRREIRRKFDEIVDFSGVEKFIDTPVKRYSSGMYVRLAFAVAAHLDPEILLVDEVLAVGDAQFQKRCLGKMQDVTKQEGRTILFVSHNMATIKSLCSRLILLKNGTIKCEGKADRVVDAYLEEGNEMAQTGIIPEHAERIGNDEAKIRQVSLLNLKGESITELYMGQAFRVLFAIEVFQTIPDAILEVDISTPDGTYLTTSYSTDNEQPTQHLVKGKHCVALELSPHLLPGHYTLDLGLHHNSHPWTIDFVRRTLDFEILNVAEAGTDAHPFSVRRGFIRPSGQWQILPAVAAISDQSNSYLRSE